MYFIFSNIALTLIIMGIVPDVQLKNKNPIQTLEEAYRNYEKSFAAGTEKDWLKALRSLEPTREEVDFIFPMHGELVWRHLKKTIGDEKEQAKTARQMAEHVARAGEIIGVVVLDYREIPQLARRHADVLAMIRKDTPIAELGLKWKKGGTGGAGPFLFVNKRWVAIPDLNELPRQLQAEKKEK